MIIQEKQPDKAVIYNNNQHMMFIFKKIINNPVYYFSILISLIRGSFYLLYYSVLSRRVKIKFPFLVSGKLIIKGPGYVEIGHKCLVLENVFKGLTIITADINSRVKIGNNCMLAGLTVHCRKSVEIGNNVMTARSLIQDSLFLNRDEALTKQTMHNLESQPIYIGNNVWIGGHCIVLSGSSIGADSVMSAYSVCSNDVVKDFSLITGNPVRKPLPIDQLLKLRNVK